jgi:hypothetical protein
MRLLWPFRLCAVCHFPRFVCSTLSFIFGRYGFEERE